MSQPKVLGPAAAAGATAATLPVTGNSVFAMVLLGLGMVAAGLLVLRATRQRPVDTTSA